MTGTFEDLVALGVPAVLAGINDVELGPEEGSPRWGLSANLRPDLVTAARLDALTSGALDAAGGGHWPTGAALSSHVTIRPLEHVRHDVPLDDPVLGRYTGALIAAAWKLEPITFDLRRVVTTPSCVLVEAEPCDPDAASLARRFGASLTSDGDFWRGKAKDRWYVSLVHFAGPVEHGEDLVAWVDRQEGADLGVMSCHVAQIIEWRFGVDAIEPRVLAEVPLDGRP